MSAPQLCLGAVMTRIGFRHVRGVFGAAAVVFSCALVSADQVTVPASADNTMFEESPDISNGAGDYFFCGQTNSTSNLRRGLVRFDVAGAVPAGSTIDSVELVLYMSRAKANNDPVSLHLGLADWGEGTSDGSGEEGQGAPATQDDATWAYTFYNASSPASSPTWATPGGEFHPVASATVLVKQDAFYSWTTPLMTNDVQMWLDFPTSNFGWTLLGDETTTATAARFNSRTSTDLARRPQLVINFTPSAATGACELPGGDCIIDTEGNCIAAGGTYLGDETVCPDPTGACCLPDGSCITDTENNCIAAGGVYQGDGFDCVDADCPVILEPYVDPLPIPAIATPTTGSPGSTATYDIPMLQVSQQLHRDLPPTTLWTYAGTFPGPTILAREGNPVTVNWLNDLRDEFGNLRTDHYLDVDLCMHGAENLPKTVVHLHGGHVPPEVDGYPEDTFLPGQQVTYEYPLNQRAGLSWYHDHALGITRLNVMMGLAGAFVIRDAEEDALGLPAGEYEAPLIIQDRSFNADGSLDYPSTWAQQFFGDYMLVNGMVTPFLEVKQATYRFRALNGCNSRTLTLSLSNGQVFDVIGVDGGLLDSPQTVTQITLGGAERADLLVDFSQLAPGTEIEVVNSAPAPFPGSPGVGVLPQVMKFVVTSDSGPVYQAPALLSVVDPLDEQDALENRDFVLDRFGEACAGSEWLINGLHWDDITEFPRLGSTEVWRFVNPTGTVHPMHMHLVFFQVLDKFPMEIVGGVPTATGPAIPLEPSEQGWKDTVRVGRNEMVRVIARFEDYEGLYAYHCHILEHEDHEMMRQFQVVGCVADVTTTGATLIGQPGFGEPDGISDLDDLGYFLGFWLASDPSVADVTTTGATLEGQPGYGVADGAVDLDDLGYFLGFWLDGCP